MSRRVYLPWLLVLVCAGPAAAATYYVSPSGNNANPGTSPDRPWLSIDRVNAHTFAPGDHILFQAGHTFSGQLFFDAADAGTPLAPVVVSSYGTGRATIYPADGRGILIYNAGGFEVRDLFVVGSGRDANVESGILVLNDQAGDVLLDHIVIDHVDAVRFGRYGVEIAGTSGGSGFRNVRIAHTIASENGLGGIFTHAARRAVHRNVYVGHSSAFLNAGFAGLLFNSGNGITLSGVDGGTIERSVARENGWRCTASNGPIGIWTYDSNNVLIQLNESFNNMTGGTKDGGGFSLDNSTSNSTLQYNYSHDNAGAGFMLAHKWDDQVHSGNVIRWNISQNDARKNQYAAIQTWGRIRNAEVYHNTVYMTYTQGAQRGIYVRNRSIELQDPERLHFRNNIIQTNGGVPVVAVDASAADAAVDLRFEGNLYWPTGSALKIHWRGVTYSTLAAWRTASGQERVSGADVGLVVDPQLTAAGGGRGYNNASLIHDVWPYRLRATSPAIDAGLDLSPFGVAHGGRDYFGAPALLNRPDIGAHEFHGDCNWTITPSRVSVAAAGGGGEITVSMSSVWGCGWAATSTQPWVGASPESGEAAGTTRFFVVANAGAARTGSLRIANQTFTIAQEGVAPPPPTGTSGNSDVGAVGVAGSTSESAGTYTLRGAGADIWGSADAFHFAWQQVTGDWEMEARVASVENVHAWTKAGVMIRASLDPGAAHGSMMVTPGKGLAYQFRAQNNGLTAHMSGGAGTAPHFVKIARQGATVTAYRRAPAAASWTRVGEATIALGTSVYVGLFVSSHDGTRLATAVFDSIVLRELNAPPPPPEGLPDGWASLDIGAVAAEGNASFASGTFTVRGSGADIWGTADEFHFVHRTLTGDGEIVARVASVQNRHAWSKAGVMFRESLDAGSKHATMFTSAARGLAFQRRSATNGLSTSTAGALVPPPRWIKMVRAGNVFSAFESSNGTTWTLVGSEAIVMSATVHVGLAVTSHADGTLSAAVFDSVTIKP
jgi:hypothetical protein